MKTYKNFDKDDPDYWIERLRTNEPGIEISFTLHYKELQALAYKSCDSCPMVDELTDIELPDCDECENCPIINKLLEMN